MQSRTSVVAGCSAPLGLIFSFLEFSINSTATLLLKNRLQGGIVNCIVETDAITQQLVISPSGALSL
ncbi:hypothetical protein D1614_13530 [Maribellus luteus]|uniref:Uncharacterized protein n=1 Tax=Maribellus luteus TaxID=2305463 RepID=A0A399SY78_9BACT|nr:hypothetical protein D1614_13530 [Maribellus luteus]